MFRRSFGTFGVLFRPSGCRQMSSARKVGGNWQFGVMATGLAGLMTSLCVVGCSEQEDQVDFKNVKVLRNKPLGKNARLVRLALDKQDVEFKYDFGSYVVVRGVTFNVDESYPFGKKIEKPYLPVHPVGKLGHLDLIVKTYPYPDGDTSRFIADLKQGSSVEIMGPVRRSGVQFGESVKYVGLILAGSGVTAGIQFLRLLTAANKSDIKVSLIISDKSEDDLIYNRELNKICAKFPNVKIYHTLTRQRPPKWDQGHGRITPEMLKARLPFPDGPETALVVVGPDVFVKHVAGDDTKPNSIHYESKQQQQQQQQQHPQASHHHHQTRDDGSLLWRAGFRNTDVIIL